MSVGNPAIPDRIQDCAVPPLANLLLGYHVSGGRPFGGNPAMITLHRVKRKTGAVWMLRWYDSRGKRCGETIGKVGVMTKRQAEHVRRERQGKLDNRLIPRDRPKRMALQEFLRRDRQAVAVDVKPKTIEELRIAADHAIRALGTDYDVQQLDYADVGRIKSHLADRKLASATICKTIRHLQGAFSRGVRLRLIASNPFQGVTLPKVQPKPVRTYQPQEIAAMIAVAPDLWWEALIRLGYTSGLRRGELLNLQWLDVDFDVGIVKVQSKVAGSFVVRDQTYPIFGWTSKSYHDRAVPIPQETVTALQRLKAKSGGSAYVFLGLDRLAEIGAFMASNDGKLSANYKLVCHFEKSWDDLQSKAGARLSKGQPEPYQWERRTLHDLRRTYGSLMASHVPIHELKALLGHSSIRTTERYYLAVGNDVADRVRSVFSIAVSA